ncbi:GntR family transcriptional regulator [Terrihabitans soli]|uniref:GntR family transcriptional regulator n=1 Tax=Terrihabitans soli TaxID=708113 RepID=A0A6S6QS21_9HYPH|nr:FCD domain-containing protein [Terrihabitans soli]BCJ90515.1 GntR family transcriptional regulator [Terrihabitans soli]
MDQQVKGREGGADYHAALTQLRAFIAQQDADSDTRLPPERELCENLGVSRGELRKALAILESEGQLWRHVGRGTFIGQRPIDESDVGTLSSRTNPSEVMRARLLIEPAIAREAAMNARASDIEDMRICLRQSREAETWRRYENCDNRFHRSVAQAAGNTLLIGLFDTLNAVRRAVVWGRLRADAKAPSPSHHSFREHEEIVQAIESRDVEGAGRAMRQHLESVERKLLERAAISGEDDR